MVYFDNAATTYPKPEAVYAFTDKFYREGGVNVGRGQYAMADRANMLVKETRGLLLEMFHCPNRQVVFTHSATEAINIILQGLPWREKCTVYITPFEHNAVLRVLHYLSSKHQMDIQELFVDRNTLEYDVEKIRYQFQEKVPDVVIMSHASNVCGAVAPINEICSYAKKYDAITVIDMAQTAGLIDTDLTLTKADYAVFAGHKTLYAPFGIAGFIADKGTSLKPLLYGGTGVDSSSPTLPIDLPERFEVGSMNLAAIAGLNAALKWINQISILKLRKTEREITGQLINTLRNYENIRIFCVENHEHIGVVSCTFNGYSSDGIGQVLSEQNVAARSGLHCAPTAHKFLGTFPGGTVRFSISYFNTSEDIIELDKALKYIRENS